MPEAGFAAIVLAGDRSGDDPLALASGHGCKALLEIAGRPMVLRVLDALRAAATVDAVVLSGPSAASVSGAPALASCIEEHGVDWQPPQATPSSSAYAALSTIETHRPVLLTTADHPLLQARFIDHFCQAAADSDADVVVGLAPYELVQPLFPAMKKTLLRFADADYCGCNLFAFLTPAGRTMADRWREVERERKTPLRLIRLLGWGAVLRYRLGWLTLAQAMELLSRRMGLRLAAVVLPFGDAAVDVDSLADHALVEQRLLQREPQG